MNKNKQIFFISIILCAINIPAKAQSIIGVGINTSTPKRALDINGDLRVRNTEYKKTDTDYSKVLVTNAAGEIETWSKQNIQDKMISLAVENKILYYSTTPISTNSVKCGKFDFSFSSTTQPQIRLATSSSSNTIFYFTRIRKINGSNSSFSSDGRTLRTNQSATIAIANNWVNIGTVSNVNTGTTGRLYAVNTLDEYYISYPGDNNLYRITFLARKMTDTANSYTMLCEKF